MPTKFGWLIRIVVVPLFVFIVAIVVEESQSHPVESLCLRRCHLLAAKSSGSKVLRFLSCHQLCSDRTKQVTDQRGLIAHNSVKHRTRKALKPIPACGVSSPHQTLDWTPSKVNVTFGQYENTSHWYVNVSWTPLNESYGNWDSIVIKLVVKGHNPIPNSIAGLRIHGATCSHHPKNQTFLNINLSSYQYHYPDPILLKVIALPYSPKEDIAEIQQYEPPVPASSTVQQTTPAKQSTTSHTTGVLPTTSAKSSCSRDEYGEFEWHPQEVKARFTQRIGRDWFVNISWTPLKNSTVHWTSYYVSLSITNGISPDLCFKLPKNQSYLIVDHACCGWKYPQRIDVGVIAYPFPKQAYYHMVPITPAPATVNHQGCDRKEYGEFEWHPQEVKGRFTQRVGGDWFVNISWTPFKNSSVNWTSYYIQFYIDTTSKQERRYEIMQTQCFKLPKNQTYFIVDHTSHGWKYPQRINVLVTAYPFPKHINHPMVSITPTQELPPITATASSPTSRTHEVVVIVFASVGSVFLLVLSAVMLFLRYRRNKSSSVTTVAEPTRTSFKYHAFIIYSMTESDWVDNTLLPTLQSHQFKCCVHWRDFLPGRVFHESIVDSVYNSYKVIAVVSTNFFDKENCLFEINHAVTRLMNQGDDCLILIKYDDVDLDIHLRSVLNRSYIDLPRPTDRSTWESRIVNVLKEAVIEEEESVHKEENTNNNNLSERHSTNNDGTGELICSCQSCELVTVHGSESTCRS